MDWILQKDGERKQAHRHKKAAAAKSTAAGLNRQQGQDMSTASGTGGPAAAAAALQAFGAVVDLCAQPGCRRTRLLRHFGEELSSSSPGSQAAGATAAAAGSRCCDHCDNPGLVSAYAQQLKDQEVELLQRPTRRASYTNKRRKGGDGLFGDVWGGVGSDEEEEAGSGE